VEQKLEPWEQPGLGELFRPSEEVFGKPTAAASRASAPTVSSGPTANVADEVVPLTGIRQAIADHMVLSKRTSPHVTTVFEVDLSRVVAHRIANKANFERDGVNLTFTPYFAAATIAALKKYPLVNSSWSDNGIVFHRAINLGVAVSLGADGLIVPVIKNAESLNLLGLARAVNDLADRARRKQLKPDDVQDGTFTITNHGISGSLFATPVINQPQCGILGVGVIQKRVVVVTQDGVDAIAIKPMVYVGLTFDHRILDGNSADNFVAAIKQLLENWV
jgi:pyruvate/2-oxoglutarate dehydrogenase complex dihydrolipoamide acyltransferase (E2) component